MAAVRCLARRLGGSLLQRTQAEEGRRLVPSCRSMRSRLLSTEASGKHSIPHRASQLKQAKEELFDLITQAEAVSATTWYDRRVLLDLVMQVKPRPNDPQWRNVVKRKVVRATLFAGGTYIYWLTLRWFNNSRPKIVNYNGYKVTAESLPVLQGCQPAATAEGLHKQDGVVTSPCCSRCGNFLPEKCAYCGLNLPRPK